MNAAEKKMFVKRMLSDNTSINWGREMHVVKQIEGKYNEEFLSQVSPPFKLNSLVYFLGEKGKKWLDRKQREYYHTTRSSPESEEVPDEISDIEVDSNQSLFDFLHE